MIPAIPSDAICIQRTSQYTPRNHILRWWHNLEMQDKAACVWLLCCYTAFIVWLLVFGSAFLIIGAR